MQMTYQLNIPYEILQDLSQSICTKITWYILPATSTRYDVSNEQTVSEYYLVRNRKEVKSYVANHSNFALFITKATPSRNQQTHLQLTSSHATHEHFLFTTNTNHIHMRITSAEQRTNCMKSASIIQYVTRVTSLHCEFIRLRF